MSVQNCQIISQICTLWLHTLVPIELELNWRDCRWSLFSRLLLCIQFEIAFAIFEPETQTLDTMTVDTHQGARVAPQAGRIRQKRDKELLVYDGVSQVSSSGGG